MWVLLSLLSLLLVIVLAMWRREVRQSQSLEQMVGDLVSETQSKVRVFDEPRFRRIASLLSRLASRHREMKQRLEEDNLGLKEILRSLVEGLMVVDQNHVIRQANDSLVSLFKLKADPTGQTVLVALREAVIEEVVNAVFAGGKAISREFVMYRGAQTPRYFTVNAVPLTKRAGTTGEADYVVHDITEVRQMEMTQKEFVANVSHELRTPLSIFQGYVETLIDYPAMSRKELLSNLEVMRRHSLRLNALLEDLQILTRLESRRDSLEHSLLAVKPLFQRLEVDWKPKLEQKNISLKVEVAEETPALYADEFRFEQVMVNLIDNALKYTPEGGAITLSASKNAAPGAVKISVQDTGVGIPPADLPHVFDRFYRVDKARGRDAGGTGLGLSIVRHIVQMHGGEIGIESTYGAGTQILMHFPAPPTGVLESLEADSAAMDDQVAG